MTALIHMDRSWGADDDGDRPIRFCARCGVPAGEPPGRPQGALAERVCGRCGMGLMLRCARAAMPGSAASFLVARFDLGIAAVSHAAESLVGPEEELIESSVLDVFTSPLGDEAFARDVARAAQRPIAPVVLPVRLVEQGSRRVGTMAARIATCGPPRAALITVEQSDFGLR